MFWHRLLGVLFVWALGPILMFAQVAKSLERILELLPSDESSDRQVIIEQLTDLLEHPLDLNNATAEQIVQLPFVDDFIARNILLLRSQKGGFVSVYEIKEATPELSSAYLELLEPFIYVGKNPYSSGTLRARHDFFVGSSLRPKDRLSNSVELKYEGRMGAKLSWHFAGQKDIGEPWLPLRSGVFDYLTGSFRWGRPNYRLVLGDYQLTIGHGLLLGMSGGYFSKLEYGGSGVGTWVGQLKPHRSFRESGYLRGVALHYRSPSPLSFLLFAGYEPTDARIEKDHIRTLYRSGLRRTNLEREHRHTARCEMVGGYLSYRMPSLELALTSMLYRYRSSRGEALLPYRLYPQRHLLLQNSLCMSYSKGGFRSTMELVLAEKSRSAVQAALAYRNGTMGTLTLQGHYYGDRFISPYSTPNSYPPEGYSERGLRLMWRGEIAYMVTASLYLERFRRMSPNATIPGHVFSASIYHTGDPWQTSAVARYVSMGSNQKRFTMRFRGDCMLTPSWNVRAGLQFAKQMHNPLGTSLYTRLKYSGNQIAAEAGIQYYRLYRTMIRGQLGYMPYMYTPSMLRGDGVHCFALVRYQLTSNLQLNARVDPSFLCLSLMLRIR